MLSRMETKGQLRKRARQREQSDKEGDAFPHRHQSIMSIYCTCTSTTQNRAAMLLHLLASALGLFRRESGVARQRVGALHMLALKPPPLCW